MKYLFNNELVSIGGTNIPVAFIMDLDIVPLPAPGAPANHITSRGNEILLTPNCDSILVQTSSNINLASCNVSSSVFILLSNIRL